MKTKKLIRELLVAEVKHKSELAKDLYIKLFKKSLKGKRTQAAG